MKEREAPRNTTQEVRDNPLLGLITAMGKDGSGILAQEAQGQRSFVGSDALPTEMWSYGGYDTRAVLETAGVKFLGIVEGDDMFQYVELPKGWKRVATDHSMWSKLVDDKGRERARIFYKAAFYERTARLSLSCRFCVSFDYDRFEEEEIGVANVTDNGKVIHTTEPTTADDEKPYSMIGKMEKIAGEWLDKNHPDWRNPGAYWD